jgi:chemotaxis protein methyltransferase CheR
MCGNLTAYAETGSAMSLSPKAFRHIQELFHVESGISLSASKQALVTSRLRKRVEHHKLSSFDDYCKLLAGPQGADERRIAVDLLTTNETYFFREPAHFHHLSNEVLPQLTARPLRIWSAAGSTGEEAYSLAMTLADRAGTEQWEVLASDLSTRVLAHGQRGVYDMHRLQQMPQGYLKRFCLSGTGEYAGLLQIAKPLRLKVNFAKHNLMHKPAGLGKFHVVFLRNVLIYFDSDARLRIVRNVLEALHPGGWLYTSHSESLNGLDVPLKQTAPSIHRKI